MGRSGAEAQSSLPEGITIWKALHHMTLDRRRKCHRSQEGKQRLRTSLQLTVKQRLFCLVLDNAGYLPSLWDLPCYSWSCRCSLKGGFWCRDTALLQNLAEIQNYFVYPDTVSATDQFSKWRRKTNKIRRLPLPSALFFARCLWLSQLKGQCAFGVLLLSTGREMVLCNESSFLVLTVLWRDHHWGSGALKLPLRGNVSRQ